MAVHLSLLREGDPGEVKNSYFDSTAFQGAIIRWTFGAVVEGRGEKARGARTRKGRKKVGEKERQRDGTRTKSGRTAGEGERERVTM